jgi:hypothetical protein
LLLVGEGGGDYQIGPEVQNLLHIHLNNSPYPLLALGLRGPLTVVRNTDNTILYTQEIELFSYIGNQGNDPLGKRGCWHSIRQAEKEQNKDPEEKYGMDMSHHPHVFFKFIIRIRKGLKFHA